MDGSKTDNMIVIKTGDAPLVNQAAEILHDLSTTQTLHQLGSSVTTLLDDEIFRCFFLPTTTTASVAAEATPRGL